MALTILKLGGSIITHKYESGEFNASAARRLGEEIKTALEQKPQPLILIHGAGGKVHRLAKEFGLKAGAKTQEQISGSLKTHAAVQELTQELTSELSHHLPVMPLPTDTIFMVKAGKPLAIGWELVAQALKTGLIPLLSGDMVLDDQLNFSILSGDTVAATLADKLGAEKIIFATDVDGLYDADPKTNPEAKLIDRITINKIKISSTAGSPSDVTDQMLGKIRSQTGKTPVQIVNGSASGRLTQALTGQTVIGTVIE